MDLCTAENPECRTRMRSLSGKPLFEGNTADKSAVDPFRGRLRTTVDVNFLLNTKYESKLCFFCYRAVQKCCKVFETFFFPAPRVQEGKMRNLKKHSKQIS